MELLGAGVQRKPDLSLSCQPPGAFAQNGSSQASSFLPALLTPQASALKGAQYHGLYYLSSSLWGYWAWGTPRKPRVHISECPHLPAHVHYRGTLPSCRADGSIAISYLRQLSSEK